MLVNEFKGLGRITTDESEMRLRDTANNSKVLYFAVAINSYSNNTQNTQYVDCAIYGKRAESFLNAFKQFKTRKPFLFFQGEWNSYLKENVEKNIKYKSVNIRVDSFVFIPTAPKQTEGMSDSDFDKAFQEAIVGMSE